MQQTPIWQKGAPSAYELKDSTHFPDWHHTIVWDAFFNNLTSGFFLFTILVWLFGDSAFGEVLPFALTLALILVLVDLLLLVMDLGDPWRFYHAMRVFHPKSTLSVGVWGLVTYSICLSVVVVLYWLSFFSAMTTGFMDDVLGSVDVIMKIFTAIAFLGACTVICYKGVVFSASAQPGVRDCRWLTTWMVSDALLIGASLYAVLAFCLGNWEAMDDMVFAFGMLILVRSLAFALLWMNAAPRARALYTRGQNASIRMIVFVIGGLLAFLASLIGPVGLTAGAILCLVAGAWERYWFIGLAAPLIGPKSSR